MSSALIGIPFRPVLNNKGTFESGARLTVYKLNSSTLEPIFEDAALSTPLPNPLTADGYGAFPPVYFDDSFPVRVLIEESNNTVLFDLDPYIKSVFEAEAVLDQASVKGLEAANAAQAAEASVKAAAAIEATVQALVGPTYASIAAGLSATANGGFFAVVIGDEVSIYLNNSGTAVFQRSILSATATQAALNGKAALSHTHSITDVSGLQAALDSKAGAASPAFTGTATVNGREVGIRKIPRRTTSGTSVAEDNAGCIDITANITIPASVYEEGHAVSIYNNGSGPLTIIQGAGLTLRLAATETTGNRTIARRGMATIWFRSPTEAIISGQGIT